MPWHRSVNIGFPSQSIWFISDSYHQDDLLWWFWVFSLTILAVMDWCLTVCHRSVNIGFLGQSIRLISTVTIREDLSWWFWVFSLTILAVIENFGSALDVGNRVTYSQTKFKNRSCILHFYITLTILYSELWVTACIVLKVKRTLHDDS
jgi:hypothetical protein